MAEKATAATYVEIECVHVGAPALLQPEER